ncbi:unnamed protein product, partial [Prorocentrum cordatum]
ESPTQSCAMEHDTNDMHQVDCAAAVGHSSWLPLVRTVRPREEAANFYFGLYGRQCSCSFSGGRCLPTPTEPGQGRPGPLAGVQTCLASTTPGLAADPCVSACHPASARPEAQALAAAPRGSAHGRPELPRGHARAPRKGRPSAPAAPPLPVCGGGFGEHAWNLYPPNPKSGSSGWGGVVW